MLGEVPVPRHQMVLVDRGSRRRTRCNAPVFRRQRAGQIITNLLNVLGRDEHYMAAEHNQRLVLIQEMLEIRAAA